MARPRSFSQNRANLARINATKAAEVIREHFDVEVDELVEEEKPGVVFGSSLLNFPRSLRKRIPYQPVSSSFR